MVELLAPVGTREALMAAIGSGADAVYLAGKKFGARAYASNFEEDELSEAIKLAHLYGIFVYVTVNTLVDDSEMNSLIHYLRYLYEIGVDAIIVQDVGVIAVAQKVVPQLPIHASTQMTIHNHDGAQFLRDLGIRRVVLARELSLEDITHICQNSDLEIEIFVHGALCISYSGQCLMSSLLGGRSGNRGRCAQPCRLPYTLVDKDGCDVLERIETGEFLLSPKDLNTIDILPEFIKAGVTSLKIEGRMKRPEYVAVVVDAYRRAIDGYLANSDYAVLQQDKRDIAQIFNRDFTTAYLTSKPGRTMMSDRRPNNRGVRIGRVVAYQSGRKNVTIKLEEALAINDIIEFWVKVGGRVNVTVSEMTVNGNSVTTAQPGQEVSIDVPTAVKVNDRVFKVFDARLMAKARGFFSSPSSLRKIPIDVEISVQEGTPLKISIMDAEGYEGTAVTSFIAEKAIKRPLTEETIKKQVERLGNTIFALRKLTCHIDNAVMVPVSEINEARRKAIENLEANRLARFQRNDLTQKPVDYNGLLQYRKRNVATAKSTPQLIVNVDSIAKLQTAFKHGADAVMFGGENFSHAPFSHEEYRQAVALARKMNKAIILCTSRIIKEWQMTAFRAEIELFNQLQPDAISIANLGALRIVRELSDIPLRGDYHLNVFNSAAIHFFAEYGLRSLALSPELNFNQIEELITRNNMPMECLVHGYLTLMVSEHCSLGSYLGKIHEGPCSQICKKGQYWLQDRKNERFPIKTDQYCRMHILNAKELSMLPHIVRFKESGIRAVRVEGKYSSSDSLAQITLLYRELLDQGSNHPLFQQDFKNVEHGHITRGHYFRGVL